MKQCSKCKLTLLEENFSKHKSNKDGLAGWCKDCTKIYRKENKEQISIVGKKYYKENKEKIKKQHDEYKKTIKNYEKIRYEKNKLKIKRYNLKRNYNLTQEEWNKIYEEQEGKCAICGRNEKELKGVLHTDHCHKTGNIRGLLCTRCNVGLEHYEKYKKGFTIYLERKKIKNDQ